MRNKEKGINSSYGSTDIEFIEECVLNDDQKYGEMMAIVSDFNNENIGLIQIEWALKED